MAMAHVGTIAREIWDRLESLDLDQKIRNLRRSPKRRLLLVICAVIFFVYVFLSGGGKRPSPANLCLDSSLVELSEYEKVFDIGINKSAVPFIGNGHIGVDSNGELRVYKNNSLTLGVETKFYPFLSVAAEGISEEANVTDFRNGTFSRLRCFQGSGQCACVKSEVLAHRTRRNVIVEEIKVSNPTNEALTLTFTRRSPSLWKEAKRHGDAVAFSRLIKLESSNVIMAAAVCTNAPGKMEIQQRREEIIRLLCVVQYRERPANEVYNESLLVDSVLNEFSTLELGSNLKNEHVAAWNKLAAISFSLSHSKAPSVLNADRINATRYILLSNSKAPTMELDVEARLREVSSLLIVQAGRCYAGNSNLLYPSRLWKDWASPESLFKLADLWMLTLSKWGCSSFIKAGAEGVAEAFVLSLSQSSYHDGHLEVGLNAADLHREMSFSGLKITAEESVNVQVRIDSENRPYLELSSTGTLYACDGGCLDEPVTLGKTHVALPVKVTKPQTSILYVASSRRHLEQLRSAIHVSEVGAAPAHEDDVLSLHRHGSSPGSMPTSFWVFLGIILITFHVFLAKILWTEWRKGDMTPYNPYLRNRYSYARSH